MLWPVSDSVRAVVRRNTSSHLGPFKAPQGSGPGALNQTPNPASHWRLLSLLYPSQFGTFGRHLAGGVGAKCGGGAVPLLLQALGRRRGWMWLAP